MPDLEMVRGNLEIANRKASAALTTYNTFITGKAGGVSLTTEQGSILKAKFLEDIIAVQDAAQAVIDEIS